MSRGTVKTVGGAVVLAGVASAFVSGVPVVSSAALAATGVALLASGRLHGVAEALRRGGSPEAAATLRAARFCDDVAVALWLLAVLFLFRLP